MPASQRRLHYQLHFFKTNDTIRGEGGFFCVNIQVKCTALGEIVPVSADEQ